MGDDVYRTAVEDARIFREAGASSERLRLSEAAADEVMKLDQSAFVHYLTVLIESRVRQREAWDALGIISKTLLRNGKPLPPPLANWLANMLAGERRRPSRGADRTGTRDANIACTVSYIANEYGLTPTRAGSGHAGQGQSACDAVGVAWGLGYKTVEKIWYELSPSAREWLKAVPPEFAKNNRMQP